jgi:hypothetical protein
MYFDSDDDSDANNTSFGSNNAIVNTNSDRLSKQTEIKNGSIDFSRPSETNLNIKSSDLNLQGQQASLDFLNANDSAFGPVNFSPKNDDYEPYVDLLVIINDYEYDNWNSVQYDIMTSKLLNNSGNFNNIVDDDAEILAYLSHAIIGSSNDDVRYDGRCIIYQLFLTKKRNMDFATFSW